MAACIPIVEFEFSLTDLNPITHDEKSYFHQMKAYYPGRFYVCGPSHELTSRKVIHYLKALFQKDKAILHEVQSAQKMISSRARHVFKQVQDDWPVLVTYTPPRRSLGEILALMEKLPTQFD